MVCLNSNAHVDSVGPSRERGHPSRPSLQERLGAQNDLRCQAMVRGKLSMQTRADTSKNLLDFIWHFAFQNDIFFLQSTRLIDPLLLPKYIIVQLRSEPGE